MIFRGNEKFFGALLKKNFASSKKVCNFAAEKRESSVVIKWGISSLG